MLQDMPSAQARRIEVKHSKYLTARDFKDGNFILTGSGRANPWMALFEPSLNFRFVDGNLHNVSPKAGELDSFSFPAGDRTDIARIAYLPNLSNTGFVLLAAGFSAEGTEGAGEFMLRRDSLPLVRQTLGLKPGEKLPPFEIVFEVTKLGGTSRSTRIVASRRH